MCIHNVKINNKNYSFKMKDINEEDLSLLKNEIYKTTIMLNEISEISKKRTVGKEKVFFTIKTERLRKERAL